eukprot:gene5985-12067_t
MSSDKLSNTPSHSCNSDSTNLIFQCLKCNLVVGDSNNFSNSNEELQVIVLSAASNIEKGHDVFTSKSGIDVGSTYFSFRCKGCKSFLGRYYLTTSRELDCVRDHFTFSVHAISSYELGKSQHGSIRLTDAVVASSQTQSENDISQQLCKEDEEDKIANIMRVQLVMVNLADRVAALEEAETRRHGKKRKY